MAVHTPGPWHTNPDRKLSAAGVYAGKDDDTIICDVLDDDIGSRVDRDANAHLIAAAPELLAACKELVADMLSHSAYGFNDAEIDKLKRAEDAISKAEGR